MTTFEHAMVGITGAMATGIQARHGWKIVALAGAAAVLPDWDGATILGGMALFDAAHRVWGHNLLGAVVAAIGLALVDYRFDMVTRAARRVSGLVGGDRSSLEVRRRDSRRWSGYAAWVLVAAAAALSHLPCDAVYSGGAGLTDWELQLFWPFSRRGFVFPMVSWGDPGATLVFVVGMFALVRWPARRQVVAGTTLLGVIAYVALRGWLRYA